MQAQQTPLILASQSIYRRELLSRLQLNFQCISPNIDESIKHNESTREMVLRLGKDKALKIAENHQTAFIIASDQSAYCEGVHLGKPGSFEPALAQLRHMQGKTVTFYTSLVLKTPTTLLEHIDETRVVFRTLSEQQLERYLKQEQPYQCAGAFKSEGLGICLFEQINNQDPSAIIGLPMIKLSNWLTDLGLLLSEQPLP